MDMAFKYTTEFINSDGEPMTELFRSQAPLTPFELISRLMPIIGMSQGRDDLPEYLRKDTHYTYGLRSITITVVPPGPTDKEWDDADAWNGVVNEARGIR